MRKICPAQAGVILTVFVIILQDAEFVPRKRG